MNLRPVAVVLAAAVALLPTGCIDETTPAASRVGKVAISWLQENDDPVGLNSLEMGATLVPDDAAWDDWVADLPADMRAARAEELDGLSLDESVVAVAVWGRCTENSQFTHAGGGSLDFELVTEEPGTVCAWSPRRVEVWDIPLAVLGVGREEVSLTD